MDLIMGDIKRKEQYVLWLKSSSSPLLLFFVRTQGPINHLFSGLFKPQFCLVLSQIWPPPLLTVFFGHIGQII